MMLDRIAAMLLAVLAGLAGVVLAFLDWVERGLRDAMASIGLSPQVQAVLGVVVAVLILVAALRLFGGFIRVVLIVVLLAIVAQIAVQHGERAETRHADYREI